MNAEQIDVIALQRALKKPALRLLAAKARAEIVRTHVDRIARTVLLSGDFSVGDLALVDDLPDLEWYRYQYALDLALRDAGYEIPEPGYCPALVAEHEVRLAKQALIEAGAPYTGLAWKRVSKRVAWVNEAVECLLGLAALRRRGTQQ